MRSGPRCRSAGSTKARPSFRDWARRAARSRRRTSSTSSFSSSERKARGPPFPCPTSSSPTSPTSSFPLASFEDLLGEREPTFEPDGRVKDTASARLYAIRSSIQRLRKEVVRKLEEVARTHPDALTGGYVTEKGGRYCLPVRADRRELVGGLLHERSGSGQTVFVEPLAVVEDNNALAEAVEEEREEVHRILVALTARFSSRREDLVAAVEVLTELDAFQARAEFSSRVAGVFPDFSDRLVLRAARHPLLDRRLADLRADVFGELEERHADAVPLDLELPEGSRLLLLSGPNAGGKSVAMKTVGLFALLAQSGFAIPAAAGSTLPVFDQGARRRGRRAGPPRRPLVVRGRR